MALTRIFSENNGDKKKYRTNSSKTKNLWNLITMRSKNLFKNNDFFSVNPSDKFGSSY